MKKEILFLLFLCQCFIFSLQAQTLLTNLPNVYNDTAGTTPGIITAFEHDSATHKLYIAGDFLRVGNVNRFGFAVIDMNTGAVLNDLSFIQLIRISNLVPVKAKLKIFTNRIYIGGVYSWTMGGSDLFSVVLNGNSSTVRYVFSNATSDFEIYNSKIYTSGSYDANQFDVNEMDTMGNISWTKSISTNTGDRLACVVAKNNILCVGGIFSSFGGIALKNVAKVNLTTHTITTWQPNPQPGPGGGSCYQVKDLAIFSNNLYMNISQNTCTVPPNNIISFDLTTGNTNALNQVLPTNSGMEIILPETDTSYWYANGNGLKLYGLRNYVGAWSPSANANFATYFRKAGYFFIGGGFTTIQGAAHTGLGVYCMKPLAPVPWSTYNTVCQGQSSLGYSIHFVKDATSYYWGYSGTGLTITGSGTAVGFSFSNTATSGTLKVCGHSYCGTPGDTLFVPFTVNPKPAVSAGPDVRFTCSHNVDSLKGSSPMTGVTYSWIGPSYSSTSAVNQVTNVITGGNYILTVTSPAGCKNRDTAAVIFDTAAPAINHNLAHGMLTCKTSSVIMDAGSLYPGDNLHWSGNSFSQANPATVTAAGIYTLTITSATNDCINKDTFVVASNTVPPNISAPATLDTLTCLRDSVQLTASSSTSNAILYWKHVTTDSILNNSYTHISGAYTAHAYDTTNGCSSQLLRAVAQYTTPPVVVVPSGNLSVNCSFSSVTLDGSTPNAGATLQWSGPNNFVSADPATASQAGTYILTATNPQNGCTAKDSVNVSLQHTLIVHACADTLICNGSSASLNASPVGGTPGFTYAWSGITSTNDTVSVSPADTTDYIVTITDNAGCIGSDTVRVMMPSAVGDSVNTFQPCDPNNPNGQIQAYGTGGITPYVFALDSGNFQSTGIFTGLNFGTYQVTVKDSLGCSTVFSTVIDTSSILPAPDFLLSTTETKGDTFVVVDISNPRPDSVHWILPANCTIINNDMFSPQIIHADTGSFQITMMAWFGDCQMQITKNITVILPDTSFANGYNNNGISSLTLYPNPSTGQFTVDVTLYKKQAIALFIFDGIGNEVMRLLFSNTDSVSANIQMNNPAPGSYVLKVIAEYDSRTKTFLINQH